MSKYSPGGRKSNLKIIAGKKPTITAGGNLPDNAMKPGQYIARCTTGKIIERGKKHTATLVFEVAEGPHAGTALRQWIAVSEINGVVGPLSKYFQHCQKALGREIKRGDDLDPDFIFSGKVCLVSVGYRLTGSDRRNAPENANTKKDATDFLRVHEILEVF